MSPKLSPQHPETIYFDNNGTTRVSMAVRESAARYLASQDGNPSSAHSDGDAARSVLREARSALADLTGGLTENFIFTSGATESNNLILHSAIRSRDYRTRIVTTRVEHSSVLRTCQQLESEGVEVAYVPVDRNGVVSLERLQEAVTSETDLVSIHWVNNETGVIQPISAIGALCRSMNVPFHSDAAQALGKLQINLAEIPVDMISFTGHKLHAPKGIGGLYAKDKKWIRPMIYGGDQESGLRPGTENMLGIECLRAAVVERGSRFKEIQSHLADLRDRFERLVLARIPGVEINGDGAKRVCNTSNLLFHDVDGQALVVRLDQERVLCSQGSACTSQRPEPSHVLREMGLSERDAYSSIRFSFSQTNTIDEVEQTVEILQDLCGSLRSFSSGLKPAVGMN